MACRQPANAYRMAISSIWISRLEQQGFIADSSKMYLIGQVSAAAQQLSAVCYQALWLGYWRSAARRPAR